MTSEGREFWKPFMRGVFKRCPICAEKSIWQSWGQLKPECPRCSFHFERESGYWVGALIINIGLAEILFFLTFVPTLIFTWPDVPWQPLALIALVTQIIVPWWFYPRSKTAFLGFDLYFNPRRALEGGSEDARY
jgi:uncharacterized protein (DUF983 family)